MADEISPFSDTTPAHKRSIVLVDREFQLRELQHGVNLFILLIFLQMALFMAIAYMMRYKILDELTAPVAVVGVAFAVPIFLCVAYSVSIIRRTHRVAGAAYRLSADIKNILSDPEFRFHLRTDDYLQNIAQELNEVMEEVEARHHALDRAVQMLAELREEAMAPHATLSSDTQDRLRHALDRLDHEMQILRFGDRCEADPVMPEEKAPEPAAAGAK